MAWPPLSGWEQRTWVLLVAAAIFAPFQGRLRPPARSAAVELTLAAGRPATVELYLDSGRGFRETEVSRAAVLAGGPRPVRLAIPPGTYRRIRLDPTTIRDTVSIGDVVIVGPAPGERIDLDVSGFRPGNQIADTHIDDGRLVVTASGADPSLVLDPPAPIRVGGGWRPWAAPATGLAFVIVAAALLAVWRGLAAVAPRLSERGRAATVFAVAMGALIAPRLPWLDAPLLDQFSFRQTQTALTAHWFAAEGVSLPAYPLPIFGRPWTVPFEFPAYQVIAAGVHRLGVPLDAACRGVALASFAACVAVLAWCLRRHGCPESVPVALWVFAFAAPFALVWSKAALIEFSVVLCGLAYVGIACEIHARGHRPLLVVAMVAAGVGAALIKITSFAVFLPAGVLLAAHDLWTRPARGGGAGRIAVAGLAWGAALAVPVLAGFVWTEVTDAIKASCHPTEWLVSARQREWIYGTLSQRLDPANWLVIGRRIRHDVLPFLWPIAAYGVVVLVRLPVRVALAGLGMLAGSVAAVATFFNLYVVHDYYLCAVAFPLWLAAAAGLHGLAARLPAATPARRLVLPVVLAILVAVSFRSAQVAGSCRDFTDDEVMRFTREVRRLVPPGDEVVIFGDNCNSRLPYYAQRKALMVTRHLEDDPSIVDYATREGVRYLMTGPQGRDVLHRMFPDAEELLRTETFELHRCGPAP